MPSQEDLKTLFAHRAPSSAQLAQYHEISTPALILAQTIVKHCAPSAATDMAIHMLYTAVAIARAQISTTEEEVLTPEAVPADAFPVYALDPATEEPVAAVAIPLEAANETHPAAGYPVDLPGDVGE